MPVEIRELHIRVTVNQPQQTSQQSNATPDKTLPEQEKEALVSQCIDQVMDILNHKKER